MHVFPWEKNRAEHKLSAYLDGELNEQEAAELGEHLVFDPGFRDKRDTYKQASELVNAAISPPFIPNSSAFADRLVEALDRSPQPVQPAVQAPRSILRPVLVASIGILLTAGLTFAGLRRRGLV